MKYQCIPSGMLGVNTYIAWDENSGAGFILDPGGYNNQTTAFISGNNIDIKYIILTHGHGDHIGGVEEYLKKYEGAKLVACKYEKELLNDPGLNLSAECTGRRISTDADIYVDDGDTMDIGGMQLKFIHTPGHTEGGMCIIIDDVIFSGDTLFLFSIGRTDFPGGSFEKIKDSIQNKLFTLPGDYVVLPGHMGKTSLEAERKGNPFVCIR